MWIRKLLLLSLLASCAAAPETPGTPGTPGAQEPDDLLVTINFYRSHNIGSKTPSTGVLRLSDDRTEFEGLAWPELITNSVAVADGGEWVYLACGNGVLVSRDGGQSWFLTGGIQMAEVQRIWIDFADPRSAWAAGAWGLFRCDDILAPEPWRKLEHDEVFRFCSDVRQDASDPGRLWIASEKGIFVREGGAVERRGPEVRVRRILQDPVDPSRFWASSDGRGVLTSGDGGATWTSIVGSPDTCFCVERPAGLRETLLAGAENGVWRSDDLGATWTCHADGLSEDYFAFAITADPRNADHLYVAGSDGVFESTNGGEQWTRLGLEAALCSDLRFARRADVPRLGPPESVEAPEYPRGQWFEEHRPPVAGFEERKADLLESFRSTQPDHDAERIPILHGILASREEDPHPRLEELLLAELEQPAHSMFFSIPAIGLYLHARDDLPPAVRKRLESLLTEYTLYRGDTENHWVMHYTAMLLAAQTWPDRPAELWYMGRSSANQYREAREWLVHWARLTAAKGQGEYDSPHYMVCYVTPMLLLYDFAKEPEMKQLAGMMLDLLLVDYLSDSLAGAYCGGHSRAPGAGAVETTNNRVAVYHYLYAGGIDLLEKPHGWMLLAALSDYVPPREFAGIANDRSETYTYHEIKRVRNVIRLGEELNPPVYKANYMTPGYCLGSTQGGVLQPIQQHTWDVTWLGAATNSTLFTVNPSYAGTELGMFFPEEIHYLTTSVAGQKSSYTSPDKWISASPWERVYQDGNVLLALYQVPPGWTFEHVDLHWPHCLRREAEEGWLFGRDGDFFVAVYPTRSGTWIEEEENDRLRVDGSHAGFVVITEPPGEGGTADDRYVAFKELVLTCPEPGLTGAGEELTLHFESPWHGVASEVGILERRFGDPLGRTDGAPVVPGEMLFLGPFVRARRGDGSIWMSDGRTYRSLDFSRFSIQTGASN